MTITERHLAAVRDEMEPEAAVLWAGLPDDERRPSLMLKDWFRYEEMFGELWNEDEIKPQCEYDSPCQFGMVVARLPGHHPLTTAAVLIVERDESGRIPTDVQAWLLGLYEDADALGSTLAVFATDGDGIKLLNLAGMQYEKWGEIRGSHQEK